MALNMTLILIRLLKAYLRLETWGAGREPLLWAVPAAAGGPSGFFRGAEGP